MGDALDDGKELGSFPAVSILTFFTMGFSIFADVSPLKEMNIL